MPDVLGLVPLLGRGTLPSADFEGSALFLAAIDALSSAFSDRVLVLADNEQAPVAREALRRHHSGVELVECPEGESRVREAVATVEVVVIHDPLCPLVSPAVLRDAVTAWEPGTASVSVLRLVDTVKAVADGLVTETLDRDAFRVVGSPVVVSAGVVGDMANLTQALGRPAAMVEWLRSQCPVVLTPASSLAQRAEDVSSLSVLSSVGRGAPARGT
jgi:2-C-methyl-D-erythritol 4-phosphate cytidylyltransferase